MTLTALQHDLTHRPMKYNARILSAMPLEDALVGGGWLDGQARGGGGGGVERQ